MVRAAPETDITTAAMPEDVPPPPAYTAVATAPTQGNRPELPVRVRNHKLSWPATLEDPDALVVKFQTIVRDGKEIVVGRLKVATNLPAPNEHAFILRRYDTGAISVTTMFKAAFPGATEEEEEREMRWIKSMFDMTGMNGSRDGVTVKLAGHWIPPATATSLAGAYRMGEWINAMVQAAPVEGIAYRKSQRSQQAYEQAAKKQEARASPTVQAPGAGAVGSERRVAPAIGSDAHAQSTRTRSGTTPDLRPAEFLQAGSATGQTTTSRGTAEPTPKRVRRSRATRDGSSPSTAADAAAENETTTETAPAPEQETIGLTLESTREVRAPAGTVIDAEAQIAQSKADVLRLKREAEARAAAGQTPEEMGLVPGASSSSVLIDAASPSSSSSIVGRKRTAEQQVEDESTEIVGSTVLLPGSAAERVVRRRNGRIVQPEQARARGAVMGAVMFVGGALGAWAYQALL